MKEITKLKKEYSNVPNQLKLNEFLFVDYLQNRDVYAMEKSGFKNTKVYLEKHGKQEKVQEKQGKILTKTKENFSKKGVNNHE